MSNANRAVLGRMLREERLKLEMTQDEFGSLIGTDKKKISRLERGMQFPDEILIQLLKERGSEKVDQILESMWEIRRIEEGTRRFGIAAGPTESYAREDLTSFRDTLNFMIPALSKEIKDLRDEIKYLRTELHSIPQMELRETA